MTGHPETLAEAVGGTDALRRLSATFYESVLADPCSRRSSSISPLPTPNT